MAFLKHIVIMETIVFKLFYLFFQFVKLAYGTVGCLLVA